MVFLQDRREIGMGAPIVHHPCEEVLDARAVDFLVRRHDFLSIRAEAFQIFAGIPELAQEINVEGAADDQEQDQDGDYQMSQRFILRA